MFQTLVVEKIKTHISCGITYFFKYRALYEIMYANIAESGRPYMTILRRGIAC